MNVTILGKQWEITEGTLTEISNIACTEKRWTLGVCDNTEKRIVVLNDLRADIKEEVTIHEIAHAIMYECSLREHLTEDERERYAEFAKFALPIINEVLKELAQEAKGKGK